VDERGGALVFLGVVRRDGELGALLEQYVLVADRHAGPDLRALGVERDGEQAAVERRLLDRLARVGDHLSVVLVRAVREVHAHDVHARLAQFGEHLDRLGLGADGADDARCAPVVGLRVDVELPVAVQLAARVLRILLHVSAGGGRRWLRLAAKPAAQEFVRVRRLLTDRAVHRLL